MARTGTFGGMIWDPEVFLGYVAEANPIKSEMVTSNVIVPSKELASQLTTKNNVVSIPSFSPLTGTPLNYDGLTDNTPVDVAPAKKQTGMAFGRMKAWKDLDFTIELSGVDPLKEVASRVAQFIQINNQAELLAIVQAICALPAFSSHVTDISSATLTIAEETNYLGATAFIDAQQKALGDYLGEGGLIFMHSFVYAQRCKEGLIDFNSVNNPNKLTTSPWLGTYLGKQILIDDTMPTVPAGAAAKKYMSYIIGPGAFLTAPGAIKVPVETDRNPEIKGGMEMLYYKWRRILHPVGFSFDAGSVIAESPTTAELGTTAKWSLIFNPKLVPIIQMISNG